MMRMKSDAAIKLINDGYDGFYSAGLTMLGNATMGRFESVKCDERYTLLQSKQDMLDLEVFHGVNERTGATEVVTKLTNASKDPATIELLTSFLLQDIKADKIYRIMTFWSAEGRLRVDRVEDINMEASWNSWAYRVEKFGNVGSMPVRKYFPFIAVEDSTTGHFTAVSLHSPASWQIEIICRHEGLLTLAGGIADYDFGHWMKCLMPGESITAPMAVMAEGNSLEEVCDKLVKSQKTDISNVDDSMGVVFNEYCTTWGNPTSENIKKICDKLKGKGIQYLVMDSGWYGHNDGYWFDYTGYWEVNKERFPNGLKEVADYIKAAGMIPGIWFEPEVVSGKCPIYNEPDMLLTKYKTPLTVGNRRFLDFTKEEVVRHLDETLIAILKDNGYGYIKVDYNDNIGIGCDGPEVMGENLRRQMLAVQDFYRHMKESVPGLVIEMCSSGGHRLEPTWLSLASMASFSDAHEIVSLPLIAANQHRLVEPKQNQIWAVMRKDDTEERIYFSLCATMLGRMGLSGDIYDLSDRQWELLDEGMAFYKKVSDIIRDGYTCVLSSDVKRYNDPKGGQLVIRTIDNKGLLIYHRFGDSVSLWDYARSQNIELPMNVRDMENTGKSADVSVYGRADRDFSAVAMMFGL